MVFPRDSKYEEAFHNPYLPLMSTFQTILRQPETALIVVGFGFNDKHLAEPIRAALATNLTLRVLIVDIALIEEKDERPDKSSTAGKTTERRDRFLNWHSLKSEISKSKTEYHFDMYNLIQDGDGRIAFLQSDFAELASSLPDVPGATLREIHRTRMSNLDKAPGA